MFVTVDKSGKRKERSQALGPSAQTRWLEFIGKSAAHDRETELCPNAW